MSFKQFFFNHTKDSLNSDEKNILIVSIFVECAKEDGTISDIEISKIKNILKKKLSLDSENINNLVNQSVENSKNLVEVYSLTKRIRDEFDRDEILEIFQYMWEIILVDGVIDDFEVALMSKLTGLFHLTGKEAADAKKKAKKSINQSK